MTQLIKYLEIIKRHGFFIWAVCVFIFGLLVSFNLLGGNGDLSKRSGIGMAIIGVIAIFYSLYSKKRKIKT